MERADTLRTDTSRFTILTDTNGVQTYATWDSVLFDIYQLDTVGSSDDVGQIGFFTSSDGTDFNTTTYQAVDWDQIEVNDTFVVTGSKVELTEAGKYRLFTNLALAMSAAELSDIDVRIRKNGSTLLPAAAHSAVTSSVDYEMTLTLESFDQAGSAGDYYEVVIKTGGGMPYTLNLIDTSSSFIISTVAGGSGPQGPAGVDGTDGTDGVSVDSAKVLGDSLFVYLSDGTIEGGFYVEGPQGPAGQDGQDGNVLDSNDWYLDTIIDLTDSTFQFEIRNRYGGGLEKSLTLLVPQAQDATPQVLTTSSIAGGGRTSLDQGGGKFDIVGGTNSTVSLSGDEYSISSVNNFANSLSFNTSNGILSLGRNGLSTLTTDLDGRYLQSATNYWTLNSGLLYPNNTSDDVLIGTTSNVFSSKLRVDGHLAVTRSTGDALTIADASGSNKKWEFGYTTSPVESYADITTNGTTTWRQGVDNSGEYFFSADGTRAGAQFFFEDDGDLVLDQYPNVRDDVGAAPINFLFTDAFGTIQSSPPGVVPNENITVSNTTVDKYDYILKATAAISDVTITLPSSPPSGKMYIIGYSNTSPNSVKVTASGSTTVESVSTLTLGDSDQTTGFPTCLAIFVFDGYDDYYAVYTSCGTD
jgi:hypothetical protein